MFKMWLEHWSLVALLWCYNRMALWTCNIFVTFFGRKKCLTCSLYQRCLAVWAIISRKATKQRRFHRWERFVVVVSDLFWWTVMWMYAGIYSLSTGVVGADSIITSCGKLLFFPDENSTFKLVVAWKRNDVVLFLCVHTVYIFYYKLYLNGMKEL